MYPIAKVHKMSGTKLHEAARPSLAITPRIMLLVVRGFFVLLCAFAIVALGLNEVAAQAILNFPHRAAAAAGHIPSSTKALMIGGFQTEGDGGGGFYERTYGSASGASAFETLDGSIWELSEQEVISVRQLGARGDGLSDDTAAINEALRRFKTILIPEGVWLVDTISIQSQRRVKTSGNATELKQKPQKGYRKPIVQVLGKDVSIESLRLSGNIASDVGEWNAAIAVVADPSTGSISNVRLGSIEATNIRGDVLYLGARDGARLEQVHIERVYGNNVYRNVVSIVGGHAIKIGTIAGDRVGYKVFDIEPEPYSQASTDIHVETINGGCAQIAATTREVAANGIVIGSLTVDGGELMFPDPAYPKADCKDGLVLRNVEQMRIKSINIRGVPRSAIRVIYNRGEVGAKKLQLGRAQFLGPTSRSADYSAVLGAGSAEIMVAELGLYLAEGSVGLTGADWVTIMSMSADLGRNAAIFSNLRRVDVSAAQVRGEGMFSRNVKELSASMVRFQGARFAVGRGNIYLTDSYLETSLRPFIVGPRVVQARNIHVNGMAE